MVSAVNQSLQIIFGYGNVSDKDTTNEIKLNTLKALQPLLDTFRAHGHNTIDTSRGYPNANPGGSETLLSTADLTWAHIDTKAPHLNTIYLHFPDRTVPLEQTIPAIASAVLNDQALRWAISNYSVTEVEQIVSICKSQNLPFPHCYQGHYNALTRHAETALLPTLRSTASLSTPTRPQQAAPSAAEPAPLHPPTPPPAAPACSCKTPSAPSRASSTASRTSKWRSRACANWRGSALEPGLGDAMVVAASSAAQLEGTLGGLERGPLPGEVVTAMEEAWKAAKETAPEYSPFLEDRTWGDKI